MTHTRYENYLTGFNEVGHRWLAERKSNSRRSLMIMIASHAMRLKRSYARSYTQYEAVKISSAFRARTRPRNTTPSANKNVGCIADTIQHKDSRNCVKTAMRWPPRMRERRRWRFLFRVQENSWNNLFEPNYYVEKLSTSIVTKKRTSGIMRFTFIQIST